MKSRTPRRSIQLDALEARQLLAAAGHTPFKGAPLAIPGYVEAENFDKGNAGTVYNDTTSTNTGGSAYRSTAVDLKTLPGYNTALTATRPGEWLEYTVKVAAAGTYGVEARLASAVSGGKFHLELDRKSVGTVTVPNTGSASTFKSVNTAVALTAGEHTLRIAFDSAVSTGSLVDLDWLRFNGPTGTPPPTPPPPTDPTPPTNTPGTNIASRWPTSFTRVADALTDRFESFGFSYQGKLYVLNGWANDTLQKPTNHVEVYDPSTNKWSRKKDSPTPTTHQDIAVDYAKGVVYAIFGHRGPNPPKPTNEFWKYTIATDSWSRLKDMDHVGGAGAAVVVGRKLHYFGGATADRVTNTGEHKVLDLDNIAAGWKTLASLPSPRDHLAGVVLNGSIYAVGGEFGHDKTHNHQKILQRYDEAKNTWVRLADMPGARSHHEASVFVLDGAIYAAGGQVSPQKASSSVWMYNPSKNQWTTVGSLPASRQGVVVQVVGDKVVIANGAADSTSDQSHITWVGTLKPKAT